MSADGQKDGGVAFIKQAVNGLFALNGCAGPDFHPQVLDSGDLSLHDIARQPVGGNPGHQHAAGNRQGFKDGHAEAQAHQVVGGSQTGRAGADNGHLLFASLGDWFGFGLGVG